MYHGTDYSFNTFKSSDGRNEFFFTDDIDAARDYGEKQMPLYLCITNPYVVDLRGEGDAAIYDAIDYAKANDYDGVIANKAYDGANTHTEYVAFSNTQVKSATDNIGTFDGANDNMLYSSLDIDDVSSEIPDYPAIVASLEQANAKLSNDLTLTDGKQIDTITHTAEAQTESPEAARHETPETTTTDITNGAVDKSGENEYSNIDNNGGNNGNYENEFRRIQETSRGLSAEQVQAFHNGSQSISDGERTRLVVAFKQRLVTARRGKSVNESALVNPKTKNTVIMYSGVDGNAFHDIFEIAYRYLPCGDLVTLHDSYSDYHCCISSNGLSGFAVMKNGNLISVFNLGEKGFLDTIKGYATEQGATHLDCFCSDAQPLNLMYERKLGWATSSILGFNINILVEDKGRAYADYFVKTYGESPVHFMVNPAFVKEGFEITERHFAKDQYDEAVEYQQSLLKPTAKAPDEGAFFDGKPMYSSADVEALTDEEAAGTNQYSSVDDEETLAFLNGQDTVKVYRAMQLVDGALHPPMSAKVNGKWRSTSYFGAWEQSDEDTSGLIFKKNKDGKEVGYYKLDKGNGSSLDARYNPYFHTSRSPLNDQFSSAYKRPNLVVVEGLVPLSELAGEYKAKYAKDSVGEISWHSGPVSSKLPKAKARKVILSRWFMPLRIVPDSEVAATVAGILEGENISVPYNVVTPSLRAAP